MQSIRNVTTKQRETEKVRTTEQLLSGVAAGDRTALEELYCHTRTAVYGLALSYLGNAQDAQDLTQDVFVRVWDCAEQYRPTGSAMGWLLTVCRNLCRMRLRSNSRYAGLSEEVAGLKHREIAALTELPLPTVLSKYHRALRKMRTELEGEDIR